MLGNVVDKDNFKVTTGNAFAENDSYRSRAEEKEILLWKRT